jgi:3-oxoacyl-[acyl-carrier protein] reductase
MRKNRLALITGGTRGIGYGIALELAKSGFDLAVTGRREAEEVQEPLSALRGFGVEARYFQSDISEATDRDHLLQQIRETFGRLDVLVNNAGIAPKVRADLLDATEESFDLLLATNLKGPFFLTQKVAAWMIELRKTVSSFRGCIINVGSISATVASVNRGDYCISKAGIAMATRLWAVRLAEFGIDVYELRPGIISTDMTQGVKAKYDALIEGDLLLEKRWGTPEDIGKAATLLAKGDLPYASGSILTLDGGLSIPRL